MLTPKTPFLIAVLCYERENNDVVVVVVVVVIIF